MSADRHLHDPPRPRTEVDVARAAIVAILDARIVPFTPGMIGRLSTATGAPAATIKKAWELKDSGRMGLCAQSAGQLPNSRLWKRWLEQLPSPDSRGTTPATCEPRTK
jgi:hypothetical protein